MRTRSESAYLSVLGRHVRRLREQSGLSQEGLALKSGIDRTYISSLERGERNVAALNLRRIAKTLGIRTAALFDFEGTR
ncbi:MAG: helix-turn-helix transcriptional regulator [Vicinamibacterales bacterium]